MAAPDMERYDLHLQWTISRGAEAPYAIESVPFDPFDLVGATVSADGTVFVCDKISDRLVAIEPGGREIFAVGATGQGPEDHQGRGDVFLFGDTAVARGDCVVAPKFVVYDKSGGFVGSTHLQSVNELFRLFWAGDHLVALTGGYRPQGAGAFDLFYLLTSLDHDGRTARETSIKTSQLVHGASLAEDDLWGTPRVAVSVDGYSFVQSEMFGAKIECLDEDLNVAWKIDCGWPSPMRTEQELARARAAGIGRPSAVNPAIRRLIARQGGEVWVQRWPALDPGPTAEFQSYGTGGRPLGRVLLVGLPEVAGNWTISGDKVLWICSDDVDASAGDVTYIAVYDLVAHAE